MQTDKTLHPSGLQTDSTHLHRQESGSDDNQREQPALPAVWTAVLSDKGTPRSEVYKTETIQASALSPHLVFLSLFIILIMDKTPESTAKFRCHPFHHKNHVYIFRGSRFHICMTQHNTACRTSYNHIVLLEISKILLKLIQASYCHISRIIFSNSFSTRGSLSSRKDKYNDNLSTYPCCPIFISGEYFQISILYLKSDDSHSAKE